MPNPEEVYRAHRHEEGMRLARRVSQRVSGIRDSLDGVLVGYFWAVDSSLGAQLAGDERESEAARDLQALGFDEQRLKNPFPVFAAPSFQAISAVRDIKALFADSERRDLSAKELNLMLQTDIPDPEVRRRLVAILFEQGFYRYTATDLGDVLDELNGKMGESDGAPPDNVVVAGRTPAEIGARKDPGTVRQVPAETDDEVPVVDLGALVDQGRRMAQNAISDANYLTQGLDRLYEHAISQFCFCLAELSHMPENMMWATEPQRFKLFVPGHVRERLSFISSMAAVYGFFDYAAHVEPALRAFMRVYLGIASSGLQTPQIHLSSPGAQPRPSRPALLKGPSGTIR